MKKRILSLLTVLCLLMTFLPVTALADNAVIRVSGGTSIDGEYNSVEKYFNNFFIASKAGELEGPMTVTLLDNIDTSEKAFLMITNTDDESPSVLDLGGYTITVNGGMGILSSSNGNSQITIENGNINIISAGAAVACQDGYTMISNVQITASDAINAVGITYIDSSAIEGNIKNSIVDVSTAVALNGADGSRLKITSGQFKNLGMGSDSRIQLDTGSSKLTNNPEGVNQGTTIITSPATTAIIVDDGNAYLYDTLQEAVNAVEPDGTIQLLRQPGDQSVTVPIHAKFCVIGFGDADVDVSADLFATGEGYQVIVDKDGWVYVEEADIPVTDISLNRTWLTLTKGETAGLTATVSPSNATDKDVTWISSDTAIATVADGTVTAVAPATAVYRGVTITATAGGKSATCTVTVTAAQQPSTPSTSDRDDDDDGYSISVPASSSIRGGSITVSPRRADRDDSVTITVTPDDGYVLDELSVTTRGGDALSLRQRDDSQYTFEMPAGSVVIHVSFMEQSSTPAEEMSFSDVPSDFWAYNEIQWAFENGYMNGTTSTTFAPGGTVTRQQVWMILVRMAGSNPVDMAAARAWAVNNGISDGTNPGGAVTRQQLVALLHRFAAQNGYDTTARADLSGYPDVASVASYAADAMAWSVAEGIVGGTTQGTLNPAGTANRAQFAVILWRVLPDQRQLRETNRAPKGRRHLPPALAPHWDSPRRRRLGVCAPVWFSRNFAHGKSGDFVKNSF